MFVIKVGGARSVHRVVMMQTTKEQLFLIVLGIWVTFSTASLPERDCSTSITLRASTQPGKDQCAYVVDGAGDTAGDCRQLSDYLERYNGIVTADDCLKVQLSPGNYALDGVGTTNITYSLVLVALGSGTTVSCLHVDQAQNSSLWFQQPSSSYPLPPPANSGGELFVQMEGVKFLNCQGPLRFDAIDYVGISNCTFTEFNASAVDIFNCQTVVIELSVFFNNSAMVQKDQYHSNSGGLGIAYHTNSTAYLTPSLPPSVTITNCEFTRNRVRLPENSSQQQINQALNNHIYFGRGGGLGMFLDEYSVNVTVTIEKCRFDSNYAQSFGGGLYLYIDGGNTRHKFSVSDSNFTWNTAGKGSFGGGVQVALLIRNANDEPSQLDFTRCHFVGNTASFGGGLSSVQVFSQGSGNVITLSESHFEENSASDVGSGVMFASLLYTQNRKSSHYYQVSDNVFSNNSSPGGTFAVGFIPQTFTGHNQFLHNTGPSLRSVGAQIAVKGKVSFVGNNAESYEGGALYLSAFGQVKLYRGSHIDFVENRGRIGAAIVVDVQRTSRVFSHLIFNTQCFLIFEDTKVAPDSWDKVILSFSGNRAAVAPVVYTSHLDLCSWFSVSTVSNHIVSNFSTSDFTRWPVFNYSSGNNNATSHTNGTSSKFYFQTQALRITSQSSSTDQYAVFPGKKVQLELMGLDQFNLSTYIIARISDRQASINKGAFSQSTDSELLVNITGGEPVVFEPSLVPVTPNDQSVGAVYYTPASFQWTTQSNITAVVDTPYNVIDSRQSLFSLNVSTCLPGYELRPRDDSLQLHSCTCQDSTFFLLDCDETRNIIYLRNGLWAAATEDSQLQVHVCPAPFCQCSEENDITCDSLYYHNDPNANKQCHGLREGTLCGRCVNDTGVGVLRFNCRDCDSNVYWAFGFLVIGDVLVCVAILIALVKLHYTFPHSMKGLLFYIQTVYYTTEYFPASFWNARQYMLYLGSALGLYFPWDFCLSPGTSALASFPARFVPPSVALLVTIAAVISVFYCFEKSAQKRIWHGVWAFVLLLYAPLVYTCVSLLHCPSIPPAQGGDPSPRWFLDGEVVCFKDGGHAALGTLAIITFLLLGLLPLVIFFFFIFVSHSPFLKEKYSAIDRLGRAVKAGYSDRARWWGAWDLLRRLVLIVVAVATPGRSVSALYVVVPALALHLYWWPYKKWWQNVLEMLILANYCLLHLLGSTQAILDDLSSYSGTAVPESRGRGLVEEDRLAALLSFWFYWPLVMAATTAVLLATRTAVKYLHKSRQRERVPTSFEVYEDSDGHYYQPHRNKTAKVPSTDVSVNY